jgi:hypothetical protein
VRFTSLLRVMKAAGARSGQKVTEKTCSNECRITGWGNGYSLDAVGVGPFYRAPLLGFNKGAALKKIMHDLPFAIRKGRFSGQIRRSPQAAKFSNARFSRSQPGNAGTASAVKRITSRMCRLTLE